MEYVPSTHASSAKAILRSTAIGAVMRNVADTPAASINILKVSSRMTKMTKKKRTLNRNRAEVYSFDRRVD